MKLSYVGKSYLVLLAATIAGKGLGVVSAAILSRALGAADLGVFGAGLTLIGYALILTNWGLDSIGTRVVAAVPTRLRAVRSKIAQTRAVLAGILCLLILFVGIATGHGLSLILPLSLIPFTLALRIDWVLMALSRERSVATATVVREAAYLALLIAVLPQFRSIETAAWCFLFAETSAAIFTLASARTISGEGQASRGVKARQLMREGWPLVLMGITSLTYTKIDTPLIAHFKGAEQAGVYYAAYAVIFGALSLSAPLARAAFPEMSRASVLDGRAKDQGMFRLSILASAVGSVIALGIIVLARPTLLALYGESYGSAYPVLQLLAVSVVFTYASSVVLQNLIAEGRQRLLAAFCGAAAVVNVGTNLLLIPGLGIIGAGVATVATEAAVLCLTVCAFSKRPGFKTYAVRLVTVVVLFIAAGLLARSLNLGTVWFVILIAACIVGVGVVPSVRDAIGRRKSVATDLGGSTRDRAPAC